MFSLAAISISTHHRATPAHLFSEVIATSGLLLVIFSLARTKRANTAPAAVGEYIGAAYFSTSSASFANPAISVGRMFSNTFAGNRARVRARLHRGAARRLRLRDPSREGALPRTDTGGGGRGRHAAPPRATEHRRLDRPTTLNVDAAHANQEASAPHARSSEQ
jgi:hypothetical protein